MENENEFEIDLKLILNIIKSKIVYIFLIIAICIGLGYLYSYYYKTPLYRSSSTILLVSNNNSDSTAVTQNDLSLNQRLVSTYSEIIKSKNVLEKTINNLGISMDSATLSKSIDVSPVTETEIIQISVVNADPELAANITNELVNVFSQEVKTLYNINNVNVIDHAKAETAPYNINHTKDLILFAGIGIFFSMILIFILLFIDNTIKNEKDVENYTSLSVLAKIPSLSKKSGEENTEIIAESERLSPIAECFRNLKMNLTFKKTDKQINTILVTSVSVGEGKSWTTANLASIFSQANKNVLIIDSDMRKGRQHKIFNVSNNKGLSNCLSLENDDIFTINEIAPFIVETTVPGIHLLPCGILPPNPSELLSSSRMKTLLNEVRKIYDIVIIDGSPCKMVSDSIGLVNIVDTTIIVVESKKTKIDDLKNVKHQIVNIGGTIAGIVLNKISIPHKAYKSKYYYGDKSNENLIAEKTETPIAFKTVKELINDYNENNSPSIENETFDNFDVQDSSFENIDELKSLFVDMNKKINSLISSDNHLKENYLKESKLLKNSIANLSDEIKNKLNITIDNSEDFNKLQNSITNLYNGLNDKITDLQEISNNSDNSQDLKNLQDTIDNLSDELKDKLNVTTDNSEDFNKLQNSITNLYNELNDKITDLQEISNNSDNSQDLKNLQASIDNLSDEVKGKLNVTTDNSEDFNKLQNSITNLSNELMTKLNNLQENSTNQQYEQLKNSIANIKKTQEDQKDSLSISLAIKDLSIICNNQKHLIERQFTEISSIKEQLVQLQKNVESLKDSNVVEAPSLENSENIVYFNSNSNKTHNYDRSNILTNMFSKKRKNDYIYESIPYEELEKSSNGKICQILKSNIT